MTNGIKIELALAKHRSIPGDKESRSDRENTRLMELAKLSDSDIFQLGLRAERHASVSLRQTYRAKLTDEEDGL